MLFLIEQYHAIKQSNHTMKHNKLKILQNCNASGDDVKLYFKIFFTKIFD